MNRIPVMIIPTAYVPRRYHFVHGYIVRQLGEAHVELRPEGTEDRLLMPINVTHGARSQLRAMCNRKADAA